MRPAVPDRSLMQVKSRSKCIQHTCRLFTAIESYTPQRSDTTIASGFGPIRVSNTSRAREGGVLKLGTVGVTRHPVHALPTPSRGYLVWST